MLYSIIPTQEEVEIYNSIVRLHVIADSDSEEDQKLKLKVRDAVMRYIAQNQVDSRYEAIQFLQDNLQQFCEIGLQTLSENGNPQRVAATICSERYPTRHYDSFSLPSGEYLSLKIVIGEGKGQNWWCVVYPAICMPIGRKDFAAEAVSAGLTQKELSLMSEDTGPVKIKFKLLEMVQSVKKYLQDT